MRRFYYAKKICFDFLCSPLIYCNTFSLRKQNELIFAWYIGFWFIIGSMEMHQSSLLWKQDWLHNLVVELWELSQPDDLLFESSQLRMIRASQQWDLKLFLWVYDLAGFSPSTIWPSHEKTCVINGWGIENFHPTSPHPKKTLMANSWFLENGQSTGSLSVRHLHLRQNQHKKGQTLT